MSRRNLISVTQHIPMRYSWWSDGDSNPGPSACKADLGLPVPSARICDCFLITNLTPHIHPLVHQRPHRWLSTWLSNGREPPIALRTTARNCYPAKHFGLQSQLLANQDSGDLFIRRGVARVRRSPYPTRNIVRLRHE